MTTPDISVILATYNPGTQFELCMRTLLQHADDRVEIVIADDGSSKPESLERIAGFVDVSGGNVRHAWQPDDGFRLARSRNNAVRTSRGDTLLFLDHDILLPPGFFATLRETSAPGWFLGGRRFKLDEPLTEELLSGSRTVDSLFTLRFALHARRRGLGGARFLLPMKDRTPASGRTQSFRGMAGFCIACSREDFLAIDGFDDVYQGYGYEDWDFMTRLENLGRKAGYLPRRATVAHLWHREIPYEGSNPARDRVEQVAASSTTKAEEGLSTIPDEADTSPAGSATP